jgi:NADH dehydrogenase FAD-containing subunit
MTEAVRAANPTMEAFVEGEAIDVDLKNKKVHVKLSSLLNTQQTSLTEVSEADGTMSKTPAEIVDIQYDELIAAVGVRSANLRIPGASTHCFTLKTCEDARKLRVAIGESFEYASRPDVSVESENDSVQQQAQERERRVTFVIVGGGPTGVELAGELSDFISDVTRPRVGAYAKLKDFAKVILVHSGSELLPSFEKSLRDEALRALQGRGVEVRLETKTVEVGERFVKLRKGDNQENDEVVPMGITVWCAGTSPQSFTNTLREKLAEDAHAPNGRIYVDPWMRAITYDPQVFGSVFVLGDAACFRDRRHKNVHSEGNAVSPSFVEHYLPQTAQVAGQQGAYVARLLNRGYNLSESLPALVEPNSSNVSASDHFERKWLNLRSLDVADPFIFVNLGLLAYVGGGEALSQIQLGDIPLLTYAGSVAFMLWRSVYLVKQVATRNRVLVTFDWIKSYLFGRDVTRL